MAGVQSRCASMRSLTFCYIPFVRRMQSPEHPDRRSWHKALQEGEEEALRGGTIMEKTKLYGARMQVVKAMEQGLPWHEAAKRAGLEISQSTAYRHSPRMRQEGEQALREGRHGHTLSNCKAKHARFGTDLSAGSFYPEPRDPKAACPTVFPDCQCESNQPRSRQRSGVSNAPQSAKKK